MGRIKRKYSEEDNETAWRIFQLFPSEWDDDARFKGVILVSVHLTLTSIFYKNLGIPEKEIIDNLYESLRDELGVLLGKKYIANYIYQVDKLKKWNK